ncbi:MAG TPA: hypothetical protein VKY82_05925 [Flavobacterium sp.]|nr:hypothetical protein [Flavobacterium sp.]
MKFYLSISFLLLILHTSSAQTLEEQKMFLKTISNHNENGEIPYITKKYNYDLVSILKHRPLDLSKKNIREILRKNKRIASNTIHFSQIDSLTFIGLEQDNVFNYLQAIRLEKSKKRHYFYEQNDIESLKKLDQNLYHYVYSFDMPVYFNNNQLCLIQSAEYCGGCGVTKISVFNKVENHWELVKSEITGEF